jgi:hypothetical protein
MLPARHGFGAITSDIYYMQSFVSEARVSQDQRWSHLTARGPYGSRVWDLEVPLDLGEWVPPELLLDWVQEELAAAGVNRDKGNSFCQSLHPTALSMLLFAYAIGRFDSEELVRMSRSEPLSHALSEGEAIWPREIAHWRRKNRGLLIRALAQVLGRAFRHHFGLQGEVLPTGLKHRLHEDAVERLDIARHMDVANPD